MTGAPLIPMDFLFWVSDRSALVRHWLGAWKDGISAMVPRATMSAQELVENVKLDAAPILVLVAHWFATGIAAIRTQRPALKATCACAMESRQIVSATLLQ
mmetsp:Transcript_60495/g.124516  ORF Transcript_60495/g.124516 Transcript_60495/m.124516 type:complete len:101 (-) Transcript_60495:651-953(-)